MRKLYLAAVCVILVAVSVSSTVYMYAMRSTHEAGSGAMVEHHSLKVLATFFPIYDFTRNVGGNRIDLSLLVPETVDIHDFEPTPTVIQATASADVLVFNGAGLEPWIPQLLEAANNRKLVVVDSSVGITPLLVSPQFQRDNRSIDPHIWLDPVLAKTEVENILRGLTQADPQNGEYFAANAAAYGAKLDTLNLDIMNATANVRTRYFVTFHEAFAYFASRYNLTQIPIAGPFQEEPTPSDIQNVISAIRDRHLCYVGFESLENPAISQSIASQTHAKLVPMDPIEGLTEQDQAAGKDYLAKMYDNLQIFIMVLNNVGC
jgi:zinc transport system substrate-binding protein